LWELPFGSEGYGRRYPLVPPNSGIQELAWFCNLEELAPRDPWLLSQSDYSHVFIWGEIGIHDEKSFWAPIDSLPAHSIALTARITLQDIDPMSDGRHDYSIAIDRLFNKPLGLTDSDGHLPGLLLVAVPNESQGDAPTSPVGDVTTWLGQLSTGDDKEREDARRLLDERFAKMLKANIRERLNGRVGQRVGGSDIYQELMNSFFRRMEAGKYEVHDRDALMALLFEMIKNKGIIPKTQFDRIFLLIDFF